MGPCFDQRSLEQPWQPLTAGGMGQIFCTRLDGDSIVVKLVLVRICLGHFAAALAELVAGLTGRSSACVICKWEAGCCAQPATLTARSGRVCKVLSCSCELLHPEL